ncbi:hypothetical protein T459_03624 [Capsicum annuum]|uniref:Uncharacterized protein n=1 Tax=Capsicum annuum TaxID=4072 RepID=A0A2G3AND1_CAPAN|nr:putative transaldolase-like [Capsicum annuum]PHT95742.1 hypothetical protein T459_03624 [Capsicum annuum]
MLILLPNAHWSIYFHFHQGSLFIQIKYPSPLNCFQQIMRQVSNKHIVIFLDYDGTLSPIVDDPDRAFMSNEICSVVSNVAKYFKTTIINGKSRDNVYELVDLPELYYDGNRSMNIISPVKNTLTTNDANCVNEVSRKIKGLSLSFFNYLQKYSV